MKVRATLIELWKKVTPYKESDKIFWNGDNNDYSEEMERVVSNSPTGSRAVEMFGKFIFGKGISDDFNIKFPNGVLLSEVAKDVIDDVKVQNGAFIHTTYKLDTDDKGNPIFLPYQPKSLNYNKCRIGLPDDKGNEGMILYKNFDKLDKSVPRNQKNRKQKYYPFNTNQKVVKAQVKADAKEKGYDGDDWSEMIKHYRGQVMYLNLTPKYRYAISKFESVFNDLDTEYRIGVYCNTMTRSGFLGKTAILTQGLDVESDEQLKEDIAGWLGADGVASVYHAVVEEGSDIDKAIKIMQIPSQFDDKQFEVIRKSLRISILGSANNLPQELAFADNGSMFDSGEKYTALKQFYWEQCEWERQKIEEAFWKLGYNFNFLPINEDLKNGNITQ